MQVPIDKIEFWQAIASLAWPVFGIILLFRFGSVIECIVKRGDWTIKLLGSEISVAKATETLGKQVTELQEIVGRFQDSPEQRAIASAPAQPKSSPKPGNAQKIQTHPERPFSILWVDDYPSNNVFAIDRFKNEGVRVDIALNTEDGMNLKRSNKYDLVISDLGRKENGINKSMAGLELTREIRKIDKEIPILIFAGSRGLNEESVLKEAGVNQVTDSQVDLFQFVARVKRSRRG